MINYNVTWCFVLFYFVFPTGWTRHVCTCKPTGWATKSNARRGKADDQLFGINIPRKYISVSAEGSNCCDHDNSPKCWNVSRYGLRLLYKPKWRLYFFFQFHMVLFSLKVNCTMDSVIIFLWWIKGSFFLLLNCFTFQPDLDGSMDGWIGRT